MTSRGIPWVILALLSGLVAADCSASNWPSWRGPTQDGISPETNAPMHWGRSQNIRWRTALPVPGNSTPIVWGDTVFVTQDVRSHLAIIALDRRNGRVRWARAIENKPTERARMSKSPCSSSAVTDGTRVIAWFGSEGVVAFDFTGKALWRARLGPQTHEYGYGSSPVLHGDQVFLNFGPGAAEFVVALDKETGTEQWRARSPTPPANDLYGTWSTPLVTLVDGQPQLLVALRDYFAGLNLQTGSEIWHCNGLGLQAKSSPVAGNGIAVISGDLRASELGVRLGGTGDVTETHRLWRENPPLRRVATGVIHNGHLYGAQANGLMDCINLETGDVVWAERQDGPGANTAIWSSPLLVGGRLYINNQAGETVIIRASTKFKQFAVNTLRETCNASPVLSDGELFIRTHAALWCIREGAEAPVSNPAPGPNPSS